MLNLHATFTKGTIEFRLFQFAEPADGKRNGLHAGEMKAYIQLCLAMSQLAKMVRTASPKPQQTDNEKYAMRCWMLRLGFIGDEFATAREKDYKGSITVKIDAIAASAASVVAMAGDTVQMSPVAMLMIHDPSTVAMGNTKDMEKAIEVLTEVKESIINAYAAKSGLSHARIANLMSNETWMNAKKAVELGFADEILFAKKEEEPDSDPADPENPEEDPDSEPGEGEEKKPFQKDTAGHLFSSRQMDLIVLNRLGVKPEDVGQKHTEPKKPDAKPPADPEPSAELTPPADPPANPGPVLDMDGKTEDGSIPYNILMKQLECMK